MLTDSYFTGNGNSGYVDKSLNAPPIQKFDGKVKFDMGEFTHPSFGKAHIKGEYPRIQPRIFRTDVSTQDLSFLIRKLTAWVDLYFERETQQEYFDDLIRTTCLFTAYANPFHEIESKGMDLTIKTNFWVWHFDDILEQAVEKNVCFQIVEKGFRQLILVLKDEAKEYEQVYGFTGFPKLFDSLLDLHKGYQTYISNYKEVSGPFRFFLRKLFEAMRWYSVGKIDGSYSEETFKYWRGLVAWTDGTVSIIFMLLGLKLPNHILKSASLQRLLDISNTIGGCVNDLLGLKKEFEYGQTDNIVVFKVTQKHIPLQTAIAQVCEHIVKDMNDFVLCRDVVLREFSYDASLVKFIEVLESWADGHNRIYHQNNRYRNKGSVTIT